MYLVSITKFKQGGGKASPQQTKPDNTKLTLRINPTAQKFLKFITNPKSNKKHMKEPWSFHITTFFPLFTTAAFVFLACSQEISLLWKQTAALA